MIFLISLFLVLFSFADFFFLFLLFAVVFSHNFHFFNFAGVAVGGDFLKQCEISRFANFCNL